MNQMLKHVQKMQQDMMAAQEQLANETVQSCATESAANRQKPCR